MNSSEYQSAQGCYIFLEELLSHLELRAQNDNLRCALCGCRLYFHKRGSNNLLSSSISPCIPVAASSNTEFINSPNQKMGIASGHFSPTQSTLFVPMQSSSGVSNGGNHFPVPHVYNSSISFRSTQDLFSDLEGEAIKSNLANQVVVPPCGDDICDENYIFSKDLFTNDDVIPTYNSSSQPIKDYSQGLSSSSSDPYQSSEISSVTVSSVITGDIGSAITSKSEKSSRGRRSKDQMLAVYGNEWRPVGIDLKGFNIDKLAPGTVYDSNQLYFTNPHLNKRLCKKVEGPCAVVMDAIFGNDF